MLSSVLVLLPLLVALGQYVEDSEKYAEVMKEQTEQLAESLKSSASVVSEFYPSRSYFDRDVYVYQPPQAQLYTIGLIVDPCRDNSDDCCESKFGSPYYLRLRSDLVDFGYRSQGFESYHLLLADPDEILANAEVVDADGGDTESLERRRADDEIFLDEKCDGVNVGLDDPLAFSYAYRLETNGKLTRMSEFTHCQGFRIGHRPFGVKPPCFDNNATVDASRSCPDGQRNCVQVAFTQTAIIVRCGKSGSVNGENFADDPHCGTFLEIHREDGSPYDPDENVIISERRIDTALTNGYVTTTIPLTYKNNQSRILCDYEESTIRTGSMVFVNDNSPQCCCPPFYDNDKKTGAFFCPSNALDDTVGPYANRLSTLSHQLSFNTTVDVYPYCPTQDEDKDTLHCSLNESMFGISRVYNYECPPISPQAAPDNASSSVFTSEFFAGEGQTTYSSRCFHWKACAGHPYRSGDWADGSKSYVDIASLPNRGCGYACDIDRDPSCDQQDTEFSFAGHVGKVTCVPTVDILCIDPSDDRYDDDEDYYLVTFNDNRTSYAFRETDLVLHQPRANYQLWWVQRTRHNFVIQKKKNFRVSEPKCTYDAVNHRYFPYTILDSDGSYVDTYYGA